MFSPLLTACCKKNNNNQNSFSFLLKKMLELLHVGKMTTTANTLLVFPPVTNSKVSWPFVMSQHHRVNSRVITARMETCGAAEHIGTVTSTESGTLMRVISGISTLLCFFMKRNMETQANLESRKYVVFPNASLHRLDITNEHLNGCSR